MGSRAYLSDEWVGVIIAASAAFFAGTNFFYTKKKIGSI